MLGWITLLKKCVYLYIMQIRTSQLAVPKKLSHNKGPWAFQIAQEAIETDVIWPSLAGKTKCDFRWKVSLPQGLSWKWAIPSFWVKNQQNQKTFETITLTNVSIGRMTDLVRHQVNFTDANVPFVSSKNSWWFGDKLQGWLEHSAFQAFLSNM